MQIYLYFISLILLNYLGDCAQPYFPTQLVFAVDNGIVAIDEINQRAYQSFSSGIRWSQDSYAMKNFSYAPSDSPQSNYYVQLLEQYLPTSQCMYGTYWKYGGSTFNVFPSHWNNGTSFEIKNYMHFKYPMIKSTNASVFEDYWYSNQTCKTDEQGMRRCQEIYFRKNTDIPVRSTQVMSDGWEVRQITTTYLLISLGKPDEKYFHSMSKDWASACRDVNLGVLYDPKTIKIDLHKSAKVQVWLPTPPHRINGSDTVSIQWKSTGCTDCFIWKPKQLSFNSKNFAERQTLTITYVKEGSKSSLMPIFHGGGFDHVRAENYTIAIE